MFIFIKVIIVANLLVLFKSFYIDILSFFLSWETYYWFSSTSTLLSVTIDVSFDICWILISHLGLGLYIILQNWKSTVFCKHILISNFQPLNLGTIKEFKSQQVFILCTVVINLENQYYITNFLLSFSG